jgi:hypothetical protein
MPERKSVMISSTSIDLPEHRKEVMSRQETLAPSKTWRGGFRPGRASATS